MREKLFVSIIIPVYNQPEHLRKLFQSIQEQKSSVNPCEIVVCDDGSQPPLQEQVHFASQVKWVRHEQAQGAAAARNDAARAANGAILFFLDADTVLKAGVLKHLSRRFQTEPDLFALNGGTELEAANAGEGFTPQYRALIDYVQLTLRAPVACSFFTPRCGAMRREVFEKAGGFDAGFIGASVEEYEFGYRLSQICPIVFDAQVSVYHHFATFLKNNRNYFMRVRYWVGLFSKRKKFENLGAATASAGFGSVLCHAWVFSFFLRYPYCVMLLLASLFVFVLGYRDILWASFKSKGPWFFIRAFFLTYWLSVVVVAGAAMGVVDYLLTGKSSAQRVSISK